ncbi:MAG: DNA alkylation repair protein [Aquiluna sp.]
MQASRVSAELTRLGDPEMVQTQQWFFKTGPGEYGEGDEFLGLRVPQTRSVAKQFKALPLDEIKKLAMGSFHEERFCALAILVGQCKAAKTHEERQRLFDFYLELLDTGRVNNWDLVDCSAPYLGSHLVGREGIVEYLKQLADTGDLWKQRVAIMFNYALIKQYELEPTFAIVEHLMGHEHDLIHKASGWMLREAGKKDLAALRRFLEAHAATMPRTMLRYAIEKMSREERDDWLSRKSKL